MATGTNLLTFDNVVFSQLVFCSTLVLLKMLVLAFLTIFKRITRKVFTFREDIEGMDGKDSKLKVNLNDEEVERVRRNHLNDLENIPLFIFLGLFYTLSGPSPFYAALHFRTFAISRITHTLGFQLGIGKMRGVSFMIGTIVNVSMALQLLATASF